MTRSYSAVLLVTLLSIGLSACTTPAKAPAPVPTPAPESVPRVPTLYEEIEADIAALRLTSPPGNNAIVKIERLRQRNPGDTAIVRYENQILQQYLVLIDRLLQRSPDTEDDLHRALRYVTSARLVAPDSAALAERENQIIARLEKLAAEKRQQQTPARPQPTPAPVVTPPAEAPPTAPKTDQPDYLTFNQEDVESRSQDIGLLLDKISPEIVKRKLPVIIHARNMRDFRWISATLRTSIYFIDANFELRAEPHISETAVPGIEVLRE